MKTRNYAHNTAHAVFMLCYEQCVIGRIISGWFLKTQVFYRPKIGAIDKDSCLGTTYNEQ
jgi:hypothetical protein